MDKNCERRTILSLAVMSHNITPNSTTKIAPVTISTGRNDFIEMCRLSSSDALNGKEKLTADYRSRWKSIKHAQADIIRWGDDNVVKSCIRKNLARPKEELLVEGDQVEVWDSKKAKWVGSMRALYDSGRNVVVENGNKLTKRPKPRVRLRVRTLDTTTPIFEDENPRNMP